MSTKQMTSTRPGATGARTYRPRPAQLLGGPAGGWLIELDDYTGEIGVYRRPGGREGELDAVPERTRNGTPGEFLGIYRLVDRHGPDRPVYAHRPGS